MRGRRLRAVVVGLVLALSGCGRKGSALETSGGSGGTGGSAGATSTTGTSTTTNTGTGTTGTGTTGTTTTTSSTATTATTATTGTASTTGGSTGCDLVPVGGTGTAGTGGTPPNPYGPCQSDEDCVTDYNLQWCIPGACVGKPEGTRWSPPWESCLSPGLGPANCPPYPDGMDCSDEAKSHPEFKACTQPVQVPTGEVCEEDPPLDIAYCSILGCDPPKYPCPEGMICDSGVCVWPP